jgi:hypothetical protein
VPRSLFTTRISDSKAHPLFLSVRDHPGYRAGRRLLDETFGLFGDQDGNFVKGFQGPGFSARIWELSLFAYLREAGLVSRRRSGPPTTSSKARRRSRSRRRRPNGAGTRQVAAFPRGAAAGSGRPRTCAGPVRVSSWEGAEEQAPEAVRGRQRVLGAAAHPGPASRPRRRGVPRTELALPLRLVRGRYLYGTHATGQHDDDGNLTVTNSPIASHTFEGKTIPSGLFLLPEAAHLSAVLFSNGGTVAQFNRIGAQRGYAYEDTRIVRVGTCADPDPERPAPGAVRLPRRRRDAPGDVRRGYACPAQSPRLRASVAGRAAPGRRVNGRGRASDDNPPRLLAVGRADVRLPRRRGLRRGRTDAHRVPRVTGAAAGYPLGLPSLAPSPSPSGTVPKDKVTGEWVGDAGHLVAG